tara:strand:+ start:278 stop:1144 length:867 start_codon:yes stop_codon:yes gene_type:complete
LDIKEYISSGIIESYVLGSASPQERQEVECMGHIYPEIQLEVRKQQLMIEEMANKLAVAPPAELKAKVMDAITQVEQELPEATQAKTESKAEKVIPIQRAEENAKPTFNWAAAASIILLLGLGAYWYASSNQITGLKNQLAELTNKANQIETENEQLVAALSESDSAYQNAEAVNQMLASHSTQTVEMPGTANQPDALVRVFWNTDSRKVLMKVESLADVPAGKQYQLWAIVDGQPTDMGVFDLTAAADSVLEIPHQVENAQAFAITLENEGGSPTPNLDALVVIGNV